VIWFHTPHLPALTGEKYKQVYKEHTEDIQHFYGAITAMDEQVGRLFEVLAGIEKDKNTLVFFTSDNGPEGKTRQGRTQGSTNGLRGRKRSLYEGGIRVPGIMYWPEGIRAHQEIDVPFSTSDYLPTILDILNIENEVDIQPVDGISMIPILYGKVKERETPIGFQSGKQVALIGDRFKLYSGDNATTFEMYDLIIDPSESNNLIDKNEDRFMQMKSTLDSWRLSCQQSLVGDDYK